MKGHGQGRNVGDCVLIKGTGGRWSAGYSYRAIIADIRDSDHTIKVRYGDGGYKRFEQKEFEKLVTTANQDAGALNPDTEEIVVLLASTPTDRMAQALARAQGGKEEETLIQRARKLMELERVALHEAIKNRDFLKAHEIDLRIRLLEESSAPFALPEPTIIDVLKEASHRALGGGLAGAAAMATQIICLIWLRTTLYYQYRYGVTTQQAISALYKQGGVRRFYRGLGLAIIQGPLARFGDTAANAGTLAIISSFDPNAPAAFKSAASALVASFWRIGIMPLDTAKTMLQVEGSLTTLRAKFKLAGPTVFFHGSVGQFSSAFLGHFCWFGTYNLCDARLPSTPGLVATLARNASIGFFASALSDLSTNPIRVLKTYTQTSPTPISYLDAAYHIIHRDGFFNGLLARGLKTRLLANGLQAALFSISWKYFERRFSSSNANASSS